MEKTHEKERDYTLFKNHTKHVKSRAFWDVQERFGKKVINSMNSFPKYVGLIRWQSFLC